MVERDVAIPLSIHPYSTSSRVVRWLTRRHGKIATALKGALRPKSPFLGEYELFGTSELLFYAKRKDALLTAKESALLHPRRSFRSNWRAMNTASHLTALIDRATPDHAPHPELFEFLENTLDLSETYGAHPQFPLWAELRFCVFHGHAPSLDRCVLCAATDHLRFCASQGGVACAACTKAHSLPSLSCDPAALETLQQWLSLPHPDAVVGTALAPDLLHTVRTITGAFIMHHFNFDPARRAKALEAA